MYSCGVLQRNAQRRTEPLACLTFDPDTLGLDLFPNGVLPLHQQRALEDVSYGRILPRILDFLRESGVVATFFVIGRHAEQYPAMVNELVRQGHEVANHTMTHPRHFSSLSPEAVKNEIETCHAVLARVTGREPTGFRAPGYTINSVMLAALVERGYTYDASLVPSWSYSTMKNVSQWLFQRNRNDYPIVAQELRCARAPQGPYVVDPARPFRRSPGGRLAEIPTTTLPLLQWPLLNSFQLMFRRRLARGIESIAFRTRRFLSVSLHDLEFVDAEDVGGLPRGLFSTRYLERSLEDRLRQMRGMVTNARRFYRFVTVREAAASLRPAAPTLQARDR
jgi:peptidoglycan/xylan/chitin deacetylase (PgdA/CDA1 family)